MSDEQYNANDPYLRKMELGEGYVLKFGKYKINPCPFCGWHRSGWGSWP
ncbi:hypothetical protein LCGC14_1861900 [marine sediment metagenome]|uniref:Uncharacterized protein n=1 Tax=marine sediment metagenome TaxID=412755 RepID=A0A0F9G780_9ZZZZ